MPTITLAIPEDLKRQMDELPEINWSSVARQAIEQRAREYLLFKELVKKSKLTKKDARKISEKITESLYKRYKTASLKE